MGTNTNDQSVEPLPVELEAGAGSHEFSRPVLVTIGRLAAARSCYEKHGYEETHRAPDEVFGDARIYYRKAR